MPAFVEHPWWAPPEWRCCGFPLEAPGQRDLRMSAVMAVARRYLSACTAADTTPRGAVLHVAHLLVLGQAADGTWPARFDAETGTPIGARRTKAPAQLMRRLNRILGSNEFGPSIRNSQ